MKPKSYRFDRANISTHMLMDPPHMCLWASNDVPLAGKGGQPQPRKLKDAAYGPIPADIVYFQPLWFTVDRALFWLKEPQRVPVSRITHGPPRFAESPETGQTAHLMMTNPQQQGLAIYANPRSHRNFQRPRDPTGYWRL